MDTPLRSVESQGRTLKRKLHHVDNLKTNEGLRLNDALDSLYAETEPRRLVFFAFLL